MAQSECFHEGEDFGCLFVGQAVGKGADLLLEGHGGVYLMDRFGFMLGSWLLFYRILFWLSGRDRPLYFYPRTDGRRGDRSSTIRLYFQVSRQPAKMLSRNPTDEPMQIVLPPELEALVQQELDTGRYDSAIDVLTKGVESLRQQDDIYQGRLEELRRDALVGWEELRRGEGVDGATAMAEIRAYAQAKYENPVITP
jgi:antitoxin ParD1/3/4